MAMLRHFHRLFSYDDWANREVLASLQALHTPAPKSLRYFTHILSAERLWLERLREQKQSYPVWPDLTLEQCQSEVSELPQLWKVYLDSLSEDGLAKDLHYKNSKGESWTSRTDDILTHVVMHSAYHRGQIAADFRASGHAPPSTDFIHGIRQGFVQS